jgi:hypothetical protein
MTRYLRPTVHFPFDHVFRVIQDQPIRVFLFSEPIQNPGIGLICYCHASHGGIGIYKAHNFMGDNVGSLKRHVIDIRPIGYCHPSGRVFGVTSTRIGAKVFSVPLT